MVQLDYLRTGHIDYLLNLPGKRKAEFAGFTFQALEGIENGRSRCYPRASRSSRWANRERPTSENSGSSASRSISAMSYDLS